MTATDVEITDNNLSQRLIPYEFLIVATGCTQPFPARVISTDKRDGCEELRGMQDQVANASSVAVVGGGAVGVEIAADIKSYFPDKRVVLVHSREQLLPRFGPRLHKHVLEALGKLGVEVKLGCRPRLEPKVEKVDEDVEQAIPNGPTILHFEDGNEDNFDLVVSDNTQDPFSYHMDDLTHVSWTDDKH
jgi:NADH dehydrogenase FAD-containing subunit